MWRGAPILLGAALLALLVRSEWDSLGRAAAGDAMIYGDALAAGWADWSWDARVDLQARAVVWDGDAAISFTPTAAWGALRLHDETAIDTTPFGRLRLAVRGTGPGQSLSVRVFGGGGEPLAPPLPLGRYGGDPRADAWTVYSIPLADLGAAGLPVADIVVQDATGAGGATRYVDGIAFIGGEAAPTTAAATPSDRFSTLPPGAALPSGEECAARVRRSSWEPRPQNDAANHTTGAAISRVDGTTEEGNARYAPRVDGNFTGTTDEIIQWGACKWGFDEDIVRAEAVLESWWVQSFEGNCETGPCESLGLLQVRSTVHQGTYPWAKTSTAFNVDYALAWRRACFEGDFRRWLYGSVAGNEWGCIGAWCSGGWMDAYARYCIDTTKRRLDERTWLQPGF